MKKLYEYNNWPYIIKIYEDWTKEVIWEWVPKYPISMDIKITNYCDAWCSWCHEKSTIQWKHWDILKYISLFSELPQWTELAIGWWNPLSHPEIEQFLKDLKFISIIPNLTVNSFHLQSVVLHNIIKQNLIYWLWVSYNPLYKEQIKQINYDNMVVHMIAWINTFQQIKEILESWKKVLILWYKKWGRWNNFYNENIQKNIDEIYRKLNQLFWLWLLSFDNLAVTQLNPKRFFTQEVWDGRYMWDDWSFTMYMDLVEWEYWLNSIAKDRYKVEWTMEKIFNKIYNS